MYHAFNTTAYKPVILHLALCGPKKTSDEGNPLPTYGDGGGQYVTLEQWKENDSLSQPLSDPAEPGKNPM